MLSESQSPTPFVTAIQNPDKPTPEFTQFLVKGYGITPPPTVKVFFHRPAADELSVYVIGMPDRLCYKWGSRSEVAKWLNEQGYQSCAPANGYWTK